jgi:hypothetical protein
MIRICLRKGQKADLLLHDVSAELRKDLDNIRKQAIIKLEAELCASV